MKKNYFVSLVCLLLSMFAGSAMAESITDVYGKYTFTATMKVAEGQDASKLSDNCEVVISKDMANIYLAYIDGIAGSTKGGHAVSDYENSQLVIRNMNDNNTGNFDGPLYFSVKAASDATKGYNPFSGVQMNDWLMTVDQATGNITITDFVVVTVSNYADSLATIVAEFTDAKLTLVEREKTDIADISGNYTYTHGAGSYDYDPESAFSPDYTFTLTKTDESNKNYTAVFTFDKGYTTTLAATFDGVKMSAPYENVYFGDINDSIRLGNTYGKKAGDISFSFVKMGVLSAYSGLKIVQDSISAEVPGGTIQWFFNGKAEDPTKKEPEKEVDFTGTYTIVANYMDATHDWEVVKDDKVTFTVEKDDYGYYVSSFAGYENIPYGGLGAAVDPENASCLLITPGYLELISTEEELNAGTYKYATLTDMNGQYSPIGLTLAADGTYSFDSFALGTDVWGEAGALTFTKYYNEIKSVTKKSDKPSIADDYTVTGLYCTMENPTGVEKSFGIKIEDSPYYEQYGGSKYIVTQFDGDNIYYLSYGGVDLNITSEEGVWPVTATIKAGTLVGGEYPVYQGLYDVYDVTAKDAFQITFNEDGTCSMWGFAINEYSYETFSVGNIVGWYADGSISMTRGKYVPTSVEEVKTPERATSNDTYDLTGRKVKNGKGLLIRGGKLYFVK